jgi:prevent-host-death family protein
MAVDTVGIRELRDRLTVYLRRVRAGQSLVILDRQTPVARISPVAPELAAVGNLIAEGAVEWQGGKPQGALQPPRSHGGPVSELVGEQRR